VTTTVAEIWRGNAARTKYGTCEDCGTQAWVARQERARRFQCVACFEKKPTGPSILRRVVRRARGVTR